MSHNSSRRCYMYWFLLTRAGIKMTPVEPCSIKILWGWSCHGDVTHNHPSHSRNSLHNCAKCTVFTVFWVQRTLLNGKSHAPFDVRALPSDFWNPRAKVTLIETHIMQLSYFFVPCLYPQRKPRRGLFIARYASDETVWPKDTYRFLME